MTKVYQFEKQQDPIGEASDWVARIDRGMTDQDVEALKNWLARDSANPEALLDVARMWDKLASLERLGAIFPEPIRHKGRAGQMAAIAATLLIAAALALWGLVDAQSGKVTQRQVYHTEIGEKASITLPDGSEMELNTNSLVRVEFHRDQRVLLLDRGEIFVHVTPDESRPLRVYAGGKFVEAVGTAFNVRITSSQDVELIVTDGKVLVGVDKRETFDPEADSNLAGITEGDPMLVASGQRLLLSQNSEQLRKMEPEEIAVSLSWQGGNIIFQGESLQEALAEIERYTPVEFVISDANLKSKRVIGMFKAGDVDGLLATLRQNFNIVYEYVGAEKVVLKSGNEEENNSL